MLFFFNKFINKLNIMKTKQYDYTRPIVWFMMLLVAFLFAQAVYYGIKPSSNWIYYKDVEIGKFDSIRDKKNVTKIGDTLVIREHSQGRGKAYIWGKYQGYTLAGGPTQIGDSTYYVYYNVVVRIK